MGDVRAPLIVPALGTPRVSPRTRIAVRVGELAARLAGFGGEMIGGRVALLLHPRCLRELSAGRRIVLVSGSNGKTTTTALLTAALRTMGAVASNDTGANMLDGLTSALARSAAQVVVGEVDELYLPQAVAQSRPEVLVLLNLTRDQLDRAGEVQHTVAALRRIAERHPQPQVVANCDDPNVTHVASAFRDVVWVSAESGNDVHDSGCPACGAPLRQHVIQHWSCPECGLARPVPQWWFADEQNSEFGRPLVTPDAEVVWVRLGLPDDHNHGNAALTIAAGHLFGLDAADASKAIGDITHIGGRYAQHHRGDHQVQLLLAKNPAGWAAMLDMVQDHRGGVLIAVNAGEADGRDTSWLYDVAFERLAGRQVVAYGDGMFDVATRLTYADIPHTTAEDLPSALRVFAPGPVFVIADYTSFRGLRDELGG